MQVVFKILAITGSAMFAVVLVAISATRKLTLKSISSAPTSTNVGGLSPESLQ